MASDLRVRSSLRKVKALAVLTVFVFAALAWVAFAKWPEARTVLLAIGALPLLLPLCGWLSSIRTELTVSEGIVRYRHGLLSHTTRAMELRKLQDVRVERSVDQRLWGLGTLILETAGESGALVMPDIEHAQEIADVILHASREQGQRGASV